MKLDSTEKRLFDAFKDIQVIDSHEHLGPEEWRTKSKVDVPSLFFHAYTRTDLASAGMPQESVTNLGNTKIPVEKRWETLSPYLKKVRYGSYARAIYLSIKEFYGFDDINDENYMDISEAIAKANVPGIYHHVLREKCNIKTALVIGDRMDFGTDLLVPVRPVMLLWGGGAVGDIRSKNQFEMISKELGETPKTFDEYIELMKDLLGRWKSKGVVGIKMQSLAYPEPDKDKAAALFSDIISQPELVLPEPNPLLSYLLEEILEECVDLDLPVAVHTGMWDDFRRLDSKLMIPILMRHPETKFNIYHMGMPNVRETGLIGKNFPNAWLNLCWSHIISQQMAISALNEWIDLVPVNKIIAFGGDYFPGCVECIYGHLVMARENLAKVLGGRVRDGMMSMDEALSLAEDWFFNVPKDLYGL